MSSTTKMKVGIDVLKAPISWEEIEWRIAGVSGKDTDKVKTQILAYITNRCVMDRFDEAFGWDGWENEITEIDNGFLCKMRVLTAADNENGQVWISKQDGASKTAFEAEKGGISDSMKRCAVQFGLGRDLYNYPKTYLSGDHKWIPKWATEKLKDMVEFINADNEKVPPVVVLHPSAT